MLSEILQGCFSKIGNSSLQIMYHMAVPEQEKKKSQMSNSNVLHFLFVLEACFQQKSYNFKKWEFVLHLQIIHQLESESISFLLGQCNGFQPDQLTRMFFKNWEFLLANYKSYGCSQGCFSKNGNSSFTCKLYIS
jgi:hypothetical protein